MVDIKTAADICHPHQPHDNAAMDEAHVSALNAVYGGHNPGREITVTWPGDGSLVVTQVGPGRIRMPNGSIIAVSDGDTLQYKPGTGEMIVNGAVREPVSNPGREILGDILGARRAELDRVRGLGFADAVADLESGWIAARAYLHCTLSKDGAREDLMKARAACVKILLILDADTE